MRRVKDHFNLTRDILFNEMKERSPFTLPVNHELHKKIKYNYNSYGFRTKEFIEGEDLLILGCSYTFGHGLPIEYTWPYLFANKYNLSYTSLALAGDSTPGQIQKAFQYFKKFGNPKKIVAFLPLYRMTFIAVKDKSTHDTKHIPEHRYTFSTIFANNPFQKYAKAPYLPDEVNPEELAFFYTTVFVDMLSQYCDAAGIELYWNIYEDYGQVEEIGINENTSFFKNYFPLERPVYNLAFQNDCTEHDQYKNNHLFNHAADREPEYAGPHWGLHAHLHIVEYLSKAYEERHS